MLGSRNARLRARNRLSRNTFRSLFVESLEDRQLLATFNLTDAAFDGDAGSLREAITTANGNTEDDQINLAAGFYAIDLDGINESANATGDFNFTEANQTVTITGEDRDTTFVQGGLLDRVFNVNPNVNVVLENITIEQGFIDTINHNDAFGVAILNRGNLTLNNVTLFGNGNGVDGGGIYTDSGSTLTLNNSLLDTNTGKRGAQLFADGATVNITQSSIVNGIGEDGAGIYAVDSTLTITESTIDSNLSGDAGNLTGVGGGIYITSNQGAFDFDLIRSTVSQNSATLSGGIHASGNGNVLIDNSTISNNAANGNTVSDGNVGGIFAGDGATVRVQQSTIVQNVAVNSIGGFGNSTGDTADFFNSILAENEFTLGANPDGPIDGTINSLGNNIIGNTDGMTFTPAAGDITGSGGSPVNPLLGELQDNGGPTHSHLPAVASPAVDAGILAGSPSIDQRGVLRPQDGDSDLTKAVDIGAIEVPASLLVIDAAKDATLQDDFDSDRASGSGSSFFVGMTDDVDFSLKPTRRGVIQFDLTGLVNPGANILDARLELTQTLTHITSGDRQIQLHKLTSDWGEGGSDSGNNESGTAAQTGDATWNHTFYDTDTWTTPGGDFVATASATQTATVPSPVNTPTTVTWSSPQLTQDILDWAANPSTNFGWILIGEEGFENLFSLRTFASREAPQAANRPRLVIEFDNTIGNDTTPPTVQNVQINRNEIDPNDLPKGSQPTSWDQQRSEIFTIDVEFNEPVVANASDFTLTNIGLLADTDPDTNIALSNSQISQQDNIVTLTFERGDLTDGLYELTVHDTLTDEAGLALDGDSDNSAGGDYTFTASEDNRFGKIGFNFNGDTGVSVFDFSTFSYWFGTPVDTANPLTSAPRYADLNGDDGVSVFDFSTFSRNFGLGVSYPMALQSAFAVGTTNFQSAASPDAPTGTDRTDLIEQVENDAENLDSSADSTVRSGERLELDRSEMSDDELELVIDSISADIADAWTI